MLRAALTTALLITVAIVSFVGQPAFAVPLTGDNLLPNPSFEKLEAEIPVGWQKRHWQGAGKWSVTERGRTDKHALQIESTKGADISWSTTVSVQPHATYRLSGWIKTENVTPVADRPGRGALLNVHNLQGVATQTLSGSESWRRVEVVFETAGNDALQINCLFGGWGLATGTAWFDDLQLQLLDAKQWHPAIAIDAGVRGTPISKYIYGQFIEHLGRCIYGGIWAEMLEDRKFHHAITPHYAPYGEADRQRIEFPVVKSSPWQIRGQEGSVAMIKQNSFVGQQTPLIQAGGAIQQHDLAIVRGKKYVGHVWLKAKDDTTTVTVTLDPARDAAVFTCGAQRYTRHAFEFVATESSDRATLSIAVSKGPCLVGTVSLMPGDNVQGMRADTLDLLRQLNAPVYRWPGGNFVSGYNWKDGIGDRDHRPPRTNPAWTGVEHNDFGLDEFMTFCQLLDTEPYIAVNSGLGGVESAVQELQYANGGSDTPMGVWRTRNGHAKPYRVKWWGIGNEMYGGWQLGHMSLDKYTAKHNLFAQAMRKEDAAIELVGVGATGKWSEGMMQKCADNMDLISEHFYCQERPGLASHVAQIPNAIRAKADAHRAYRDRFESLQGKDIDIALDEWNYWYGPHVFGELGTRYHLKDALGIAAGLHEYARQSDIIFMANYAQTVNVIGCIKTSKTEASFATTGLVLQLYRREFGSIPLKVETESPLDVAAARTADGSAITIGIVNPTMQTLTLPLSVKGCTLAGTGKRWEIAGPDPMAYNEPGQPARVRIQDRLVPRVGDTVSVSPCSVTLLRLDLAR